jgi:2-methylisocitrate lyase-like PEP mutase family enzyme
VLFNIWDPGSAKAVAEAGAMALATSSWAVSEASGYSDGEHTPLTFAIDNLRRITEATELPVMVDVESGYGDTPRKVGEGIALAIKAGAIGCNLEDSFPEDYGCSPTSAFPDFVLAKQWQTADDYFTFELVQPVPRPIHSRAYLRQNGTQEGDATSQLAA